MYYFKLTNVIQGSKNKVLLLCNVLDFKYVLTLEYTIGGYRLMLNGRWIGLLSQKKRFRKIFVRLLEGVLGSLIGNTVENIALEKFRW